MFLVPSKQISSLLTLILLALFANNTSGGVPNSNGRRGQPAGRSLANLAFSIRSSLERHENGVHQLQVRSSELYSALEQRASLELVQVDKRFETLIGRRLESERVRYYHATKLDLWLSLSEQEECSISDRIVFISNLSGGDHEDDPLRRILSAKLEDESRTNHIVGLARLLLIVERQRANFGRPQTASIGGIEAAKFSFEMQFDGLLAKFDIYYNQIVLFKRQQLPFFVEIEIPIKNLTLQVNFYSFRRLDNAVDPNDSSAGNWPSSITFPLESGCASVLTNYLPSVGRTAEDELLERMMNSVERVSFRAKLFDISAHNYKPLLRSHLDFYFAFDRANKLIRRDNFRRDDTTKIVYDFNQAIFYQVSSKRSDYKSRQPSNHLELISETASEVNWDRSCLIGEISNKHNDWEFINFKRLQFMGFGRLNGLRVRIFEDDTSDRLPFWLYPSASVRYNEQPEEKFEELAGFLTGNYSAVYYFAALTDEQVALPLGRLMRVDFRIRDAKRDRVLFRRRLEVSGFHWNQLASSMSLAGAEASQGNLFALNDLCPSGARKSAHLKVLLRPASSSDEHDSTGEHLKLEREKFLEFPANVDEPLIRALNAEFGLSRVHIDGLSSQLLLAPNKSETQTKIALPQIAFQLRLSDLPNSKIKPIECLYLGRGQFMRADEVRKRFALTFEECLIEAAREYKSHAERTLFAYTPTKFECIIDKLYKANKELNYLDYQFGEFAMFTIELTDQQETTAANKQSVLRLIKRPQDLALLKSAPTSLIGSALDLQVTNSMGDKLELKYAIKHIRILGGDSMTRADTLNSTQLRGLGWRWLGERDELVWRLREDSLCSRRASPISPTGPLTTSVCRSLCSADRECKSYSFCERLGSRRAECSLSRAQIGGQVREQLLDILSGKTNSSARRTTIWFGESAQIGVRVSKRCEMFEKSYLDSFKRTHCEDVDLAKQGDVIRVESERDCARVCNEKNLDYMRGSMRQALDFKAAQEDLARMDSAQAMISLEKMESILDWRRRNSKNLCVHFHYASRPGESSICVLSNWGKKNALPAGLNHTAQLTSMDMFKLVHVKLYEKSSGFRLKKTAEPAARGDSESDLAEDLKRLIDDHELGSNQQILVNIDDVEQCARACTLQTHGPRPSCASFDFVYESATNISVGRKYCLLNSQSLHQLQRKQTNLSDPVSYARDGFQYWHYEPGESLLMSLIDLNLKNSVSSADESSLIQLNTKSLIDSLNAVLARNGKFKAKTGSLNWMLHLVAILAGVASGLVLGTRSSLLRRLGSSDEDRDVRSSVIRLVHRLSGVSLCSNLQQSEVRM